MKVIWKIKGLHKSQGGFEYKYYYFPIPIRLAFQPTLPPPGENTQSQSHVQGEGALGCLLGWGLRGQAWVTHTFLVMLLGVASSYRRGDARATKEAGEM